MITKRNSHKNLDQQYGTTNANGDDMNREERIKQLEEQLDAEEKKIKTLFLTAKIPKPEDYAEIDRIKRELKTARRVMVMDEKRTEPKLTRRVTVKLSEQEFESLTERALEAGIDLSKYIRLLLKSGG